MCRFQTSRTFLLFCLATLSLQSCVGQDSSRPSADDKRIIGENTFAEVPKMDKRVDAKLEDKATYLGLDFKPAQVRPGGRLTLTHYWQAHKPLRGWKVFVHVNDKAGRFVNADHTPVQGRHPAADWPVGSIIRDSHVVHLPSDWRADKLQVYTGLWRGSERMTIEGPQDKDRRILVAEIPVNLRGPKPRRKSLRAIRATNPPVIDGRMDDPVWRKAPVSPAFVETMTGKPSPLKTTVRAAWDDKNLYLLFDMPDPDVWGEFDKRDDKLWTQEAAEIFIDADGDGKDYIELQVSPKGVIFDSYLPAHRKNQNDWNSGMKAAVSVDGSLNQRDDEDKGWRVELSLPLTDLVGRGDLKKIRIPPKAGDRYRVNFFRMEQPKKGPQQASAWSPPLRGDFHALDRFGELILTDTTKKAKHEPVPAK
ncbi:MAG: carbohydrate-binding family 9-like protein [Deltaproteobacteria bacterium]|nr:carbohydrate-binding family 9-like protein [Deltaproteobacteria bacterium]